MNIVEHPRIQEVRVWEMPHNAEAESLLLGSLLIDNRLFERVSDFLRPEHFYIGVNGRIFAAISRLITSGSVASYVTMKNLFEADPDLVQVGGSAYLAEIEASVISLTSVAEYGHSLHDLYIRRELWTVGEQLKSEAANIDLDSSGASLLEGAEQKLFSIAEDGNRENSTRSFPVVMNRAIEAAEAAYQRDGKLLGVTTGLRDLDKKLGGLVDSDLYILAGRPSMGKSALAGGIAWRAAQSGKPVLFFSLEMSDTQIGTRIASAEAGLSGDKVRKGELNADEFRLFVTTAQRLSGLPIMIDERPASTVGYMRNKARRMKRKDGLSLIVIDYVQLMGSASKKNDGRVNEVSEITRGLKALAKELSVPVLALSQLSRAVEQREDKHPQLSDLRESGSIEQDSDAVMFVYREQYYLEREEPSRRSGETEDKFNARYNDWTERKAQCAGLAELLIAKNRHGPIGTIKLAFDGPTTTFSDLAPQSYRGDY